MLLVDILVFRFVIKFSLLETLGWVVFLFLQVCMLALPMLLVQCCLNHAEHVCQFTVHHCKTYSMMTHSSVHASACMGMPKKYLHHE